MEDQTDPAPTATIARMSMATPAEELDQFLASHSVPFRRMEGSGLLVLVDDPTTGAGRTQLEDAAFVVVDTVNHVAVFEAKPEPLTGGPVTTMPPQGSPIPAGEAPADVAPKPAAKPLLEDLDDEEDAEIDDDAVVRMPFAFVRQMACVHLLSSTERRELARGIRASLPPKFVAKLD